MTGIRSRHYFLHVLFITCAVTLSISILSSVFLYFNQERVVSAAIQSEGMKRTEELLSRTDVYLKQLVSKNTVFSGINIPYEQINISSPYWTRTIFDRMIYSHTNADQHIRNIDIVSNGYSTYPTDIPYERSLGRFSVFTIFTANESPWPYEFDLVSYKRSGARSVSITVRGYHLSKQIFSFSDKTTADYLLLKDGTVLLTNRKNAFFKSIHDIHPSYLNLALEKDNFYSAKDAYVFLSEPDRYGLRMLSVVDKSVYSAQVDQMIFQVRLAALLLVFLSLAVSYYLSRRFYRPISQMVRLISTYIPEKVHDYESEITFIQQNVSKYVKKGKELETALPAAMARVQEAQTAVMQHQINSHFLFNTLENIKAISVSELGMDNEIEQSILLLNTLIRESILEKNALTDLAHEIELARCYVSLMQMRFAGVLVEWDIDQSLIKCRVFRLSLQPILENCFFHAFRKTNGQKNKITVSAQRRENDLVLSVTDNGAGMNEETLSSIRALLEGDDENTKHVGVRNVHRRIRAVFGSEYGISLFSKDSETKVEITYPVTEEIQTERPDSFAPGSIF